MNTKSWGDLRLRETICKLIQEHEASLKKNNLIFSVVGYIKIALILLLCVTVFFLFRSDFPVFLFVTGAAELAALIVFWIYHERLYKQIDYSNGIVAINTRQLSRITGKWTAFKDAGNEFADRDHPYACDLDIVGQKSLFQFMNTTHTWHGRQALADDLLHPRYSKDELHGRQEAITELGSDFSFATDMEYHFSKVSADSRELVDALKDNRIFMKSKVLKAILLIAPAVTLLCSAGIIILQLQYLYPAIAAVALLQLALWVAGIPKTHGYLRAISGLPYKLSVYNDVIAVFKEKEFTSGILKDIQEQLTVSDSSAEQAIKELGKISDKVNLRHNGIPYFILNVLLLWDYGCAILYERWRKKYAHAAESWFLALGKLESLLCFSNLPVICGTICIPDITTGKVISAQDISHPLIPNETRVGNDFFCNDNIFIISGSNMSGKTTFLRTVGINLVLARTGGYVCAKKMECSLMDIMTSMRVADDLNEGISTFYAELKRIKYILEQAKKDSNMIFLIDEIFRGTNSADRLSGAKTILSKLDALGTVGIITTHDLDLCDMANQFIRIQNRSFSEQYKGKEIIFDYKLKQGKSTSTNAKFLMEMVGII